MILIVDDQHLDTKLRVDGVEVQIQNPTRAFLPVVAQRVFSTNRAITAGL